MEPTTISYGRGGVVFVIITQNAVIYFLWQRRSCTTRHEITSKPLKAGDLEKNMQLNGSLMSA